jgi:CheY-like chemotaxis protein
MLKVLVVDDVRDNADAIRFLLEGRLCQTTAAYCATEGFEKAERLKPQVVILDLCMPRTNGIEIGGRIRKQPWGSQTIIVGVTGSWIAQEAARRSGWFNDVYLKPTEGGPLRRLVASLQETRQRIDHILFD